MALNHFYYMCLSKSKDGAVVYNIFDASKRNFIYQSLPWGHCISLPVGNTYSMIGVRNYVAFRFLHKNLTIFISECPCYLVHVVVSKANDVFSDVTGLNTEMICIDGFYWFEKSSKGKQSWNNTLNLVIKSECSQRYINKLVVVQRRLEIILKKLASHTS